MPTGYTKYVFIDESGDPHITSDTEGVSSYYVITAIIIKPDNIENCIDMARSIITRYFQTGEMKSNRVGNNTRRRSIILNALSTIPFKHYSQVIDKSEILTASGLRFKKSFVKFINKAIYQRLFQSFTNISIIADEHGTSEFMREFGSYIENRVPRTLFESSNFRFGNSADYPLIQIGDMIAGSIARTYEGLDSYKILAPLHDQTIIIEEWPPKYPHLITSSELNELGEIDLIVRKQSVRMASQFIDDNSMKDDPIVEARVAAIRYLLYHFRSVDPEEYLVTDVLLNHLTNMGYNISMPTLRSKVIGYLRDNSIFIVSSNKGIKIPFDTMELVQFTKQVQSRVMPYLNRLRIIRNHFLLSSEGEFDMVDNETFPSLNRIIDQGV